jgi:hypothetical protein
MAALVIAGAEMQRHADPDIDGAGVLDRIDDRLARQFTLDALQRRDERLGDEIPFKRQKIDGHAGRMTLQGGAVFDHRRQARPVVRHDLRDDHPAAVGAQRLGQGF